MTALADAIAAPFRALAALPGSPPEVALYAYRGDSRAWRFRLWADSDRTIAFELHDAELAAQVRATPDSARAVDLAVEVVLPNEVTLYLSAAGAARCPTGRWDLEATWPDGRVATLIKGPITVEPDVTR